MSEHVSRLATYWIIFVTLIVLTLLTVGVSFLPLSEDAHTTVGLVIATGKALLVVLFFMHLLHSPRLTWLVAGAGLFWLAILIGYTLSDYLTRYRGIY